MSKPKKLYRVEVVNGPSRWQPGTKKRTFAIKGHAMNAKRDLLKRGADEVRVYETDCEWKEVTE